MKVFCSSLSLVLLLAGPAWATVPGEVDFQGLLLDTGGTPVNGVVDLDFELFDAPSGGTSLWTESHVDVSVVDGVYDVTLGSITPLTPAVLAGGALHLEITVEGETLSPRERIVAVPFALRAAHAETVDEVGGVGASFVAQIFQHVNYDGQDPPNDDPREGLADVDGDGLANFIDADNDNDGFSDSVEILNGTDINLVTPQISSLTPDLALPTAVTPVVVTGLNFESGFTVDFGGNSLTPTNVTSTSFEVDLGPNPTAGLVALTVTNPGGEADASDFRFRRLRAFTSSALATGLPAGGLASADTFCQARADAAGLEGSFLAWLSDATTSPSARFTASTFGWERVDGVKIADDYADLVDGSIDNQISVNENGGNQGSGIVNVFTGTATDGTPSGEDCVNWSVGVGTASGGISSTKDNRWTDGGSLSCGSKAHVYCFEQ